MQQKNGLRLREETDYTEEAKKFLTEERFGRTFDSQLRALIVEKFPQIYLYEGYQPSHAELAAAQLRQDILFMGHLYREGQAVYRQLISEKV